MVINHINIYPNDYNILKTPHLLVILSDQNDTHANEGDKYSVILR